MSWHTVPCSIFTRRLTGFRLRSIRDDHQEAFPFVNRFPSLRRSTAPVEDCSHVLFLRHGAERNAADVCETWQETQFIDDDKLEAYPTCVATSLNGIGVKRNLLNPDGQAIDAAHSGSGGLINYSVQSEHDIRINVEFRC